MNRRNFLSSTMLSSLGLLALAGPARAFSERQCDASSGDRACNELLKHREMIAQLDASLAQKGLNEDERRQVLATAVCPFCGQPLFG